jgi:hypothetical protein
VKTRSDVKILLTFESNLPNFKRSQAAFQIAKYSFDAVKRFCCLGRARSRDYRRAWSGSSNACGVAVTVPPGLSDQLPNAAKTSQGGPPKSSFSLPLSLPRHISSSSQLSIQRGCPIESVFSSRTPGLYRWTALDAGHACQRLPASTHQLHC